MTKIALDGLGGDSIEEHLLEAIQVFLSQNGEAELGLATSQVKFKSLIDSLPDELRNRLSFINGPEKIEFSESPVQALKVKKNSSIKAIVDVVKSQEYDALVSFGHTGAAVAASQLRLGLLPGVERAGLAAILPNKSSYGLLMDVGANLKCKPEHLLQYAEMADLYCKKALAIEKPRVGLLNIGAEKGKGDSLLKKSHALFEVGDFEFVGNVEGHQIFDGSVDIIVCNGLIGNIILKSAESLASMLFDSIEAKIISKLPNGSLPEGLEWSLSTLASKHGPDSRGASRLLGVNGLVLIGHGSAGCEAIVGALNSAYRELTLGLQPALSLKLARSKKTNS